MSNETEVKDMSLFVELVRSAASQLGKASAAALTAEQRQARARHAAMARWAKAEDKQIQFVDESVETKQEPAVADCRE